MAKKGLFLFSQNGVRALSGGESNCSAYLEQEAGVHGNQYPRGSMPTNGSSVSKNPSKICKKCNRTGNDSEMGKWLITHKVCWKHNILRLKTDILCLDAYINLEVQVKLSASDNCCFTTLKLCFGARWPKVTNTLVSFTVICGT